MAKYSSRLFGNDEYRIHILQDDAPHPIRRQVQPARRDELVQALFGAGPAPGIKRKRSSSSPKKVPQLSIF